MRLVVSLTVLALIFSVASPARTWYISNSGSNSNDGLSKEKPFLNFDNVNAESLNATLQPKDSILLKGGETFHGTIVIYYGVDMYIGSYGDGLAIIKGPRAVHMENTSNCTVENIIGIGENITPYYDGFEFAMYDGNDDFGKRNVKINNVTATGFGSRGIEIQTSWQMDKVTITNCTAANNGWDGISISGRPTQHLYDMKNVFISNCKAYNNAGTPLRYNWPTGNGISIMFADSVNIENCETNSNGGNSLFTMGANSGIYLSESKNVRLSNCKSHDNKGNNLTGLNGNGIFIGGASQNVTLENCETYLNEGAGFKISNDYWINDYLGDTVIQGTMASMANFTFKYNKSTNDATLRDASITFDYNPMLSNTTNVFFDHTIIYQEHRFVFSNFTSKIEGLKFDSTTICLTNTAQEYMQQPPSYVSILNTLYPCLSLSLQNVSSAPRPNPIDLNKVSIGPNPMANVLCVMVSHLAHKSQLRIFGINGQSIIKQNLYTGINSIDVSSLVQGVYLAEIRNDYRLIFYRILSKL
ncbi:hypothetical protein BH10BAC3_BH10BAC3_11860 [soil metagenome]